MKPAVFGVVTRRAVLRGPAVDDAEGRKRYAARCGNRPYAVSKCKLLKQQLHRRAACSTTRPEFP